MQTFVTRVWLSSALTGVALFFSVPEASARRPFTETEPQPRRFTLLRPQMDTPSEQLAYADGLRDRGRLRRAQRQYRALVRYWSNSREAAEAQFAYARVLQERNRLSRAFEEYEVLMNEFTGRFPHREVLEIKFDIAETLMERRRARFFIFPGFQAPERALPLFESIVDHGPRWDRAAEAALNVARIKERIDRWEEAVFAYERVAIRYPGTLQAKEAAFGKARSLNRLSDEYPRNLDGAETALYAFASFLQTHPDSEWADEARDSMRQLQRRIEALEFDIADFYDRRGRHPDAARIKFERFIERFPHSEKREEAEARLARLPEPGRMAENDS